MASAGASTDAVFRVRDATEADMAAVQTIYAEAVLHGLASFEEAPPTLDDMLARRAKVLGQGLPWLVAELDGRVAGYAYASSYRDRSGYRYTIEDSVYVAPDMQGRGVGRALLAALLERCNNGPWRQMVAVIGDYENKGSIALHESLGFRMVGTLEAVGFKLGRWVDSVFMQIPLGEGGDTLPEQD